MLSPILTVSIFQKQSDPKVFSAGKVIFEEGQTGDEMYGILEREIDILVNMQFIRRTSLIFTSALHLITDVKYRLFLFNTTNKLNL